MSSAKAAAQRDLRNIHDLIARDSLHYAHQVIDVPVSTRFIVVILCLGIGGWSAHARRARPAPRVATAAKAKAKAHFKQGRAYQEAGAYADAIKEYEKAYALAPLAAFLYNIGQCHRLGGDKTKAIAAYQRYLARTSEGTLADEARAHVATLKLKLQVEASEAARRKAQEEAEAAERRARELEQGRSQVATEALRRLRREQAEQAERAQRAKRQKREAAVTAKRKRKADQEEYRRRVKALAPRGRALRAVGITAQVVGGLALATIGLAGYAFGSDIGRVKDHCLAS